MDFALAAELCPENHESYVLYVYHSHNIIGGLLQGNSVLGVVVGSLSPDNVYCLPFMLCRLKRPFMSISKCYHFTYMIYYLKAVSGHDYS